MKEVIKKGCIHTLSKSVFKSGGLGIHETQFTDYWIERKGKVIFRIGENLAVATKEFNRLNNNYMKRKKIREE